MTREVSVEVGVSANKLVIAELFEWLHKNVIAVIVVEDHEVFSSATGNYRGTTGLVCGDIASDFDGLQEYHLVLDARFQGWNRLRRHLWHVVVDGRVGGNIGGPKILLLWAKMPLGVCELLGKNFANKLIVEAGTSSVIAGVNGRGPCRYNGAESGAMEITEKIRLRRHFVGALGIHCGESQSVAVSGGRERSEVDIVETVAGVKIADDGDVLFDQSEMGLGKGSSESVIAKLSDGNKCSILKSSENVGAAGSKGELREQNHCGMRGLHIDAIGQADADAIRGGDCFGASSVGAEEMAGGAGVSGGSGLGGRNYKIKIKIVENNILISVSAQCLSAGLVFVGASETLGFDGVFLMDSGRAWAVATGLLAGIPVDPTVLSFDPDNIRQGSRVGIA